MHRQTPRLLLASLLCWAVASPASALEVVATLPDLAAIAKAVGGKDVKVTALAPPNMDPHYVDPRPNLMLPLRSADLLVVNGLALEQGWLPPLITGARNGKILAGTVGYLDASFFVDRLQVASNRVNRAMGDVHPGGNPHFTHEASSGARIARALAQRMAQLDPAHAKGYQERAKKLITWLDTYAKAQRARFLKLPAAKRKVVSYHLSLTYLYRWLGLTEVATVEPRPGIPPTPSHTARVLTLMRGTSAKVIVQESFYPKRVSQTLARLVKGRVAILPGGTRFAKGETYQARLKRTVDAVYAAVSK